MFCLILKNTSKKTILLDLYIVKNYFPKTLPLSTNENSSKYQRIILFSIKFIYLKFTTIIKIYLRKTKVKRTRKREQKKKKILLKYFFKS